MNRRLFLLSFTAFAAAFGQEYKLELIATPAPGLPAAYASVIEAKGYRVTGPSGPWCEVWFRKSIPVGTKPADDAIAFGIPQGTLLGIFRFPANGADRRGQQIKPGVFTMRYSNFRVDGAHQGVAPQRDFALLTPVSSDPDPLAMPGFDALVQMSQKASGSPHPAVFSLETPTATTFPSVTKEGEHDWTLNVKAGDLALSMIVAGKVE